MIQYRDWGVGYFQEASLQLHTRMEKEKENIHAWPIGCLQFLIRCRVDALDLTLKKTACSPHVNFKLNKHNL